MDKLDELVRDLTSVVPRPKSEVRRRLMDLLDTEKHILLEKVLDILTDEIATAHTTVSGKTSRLTSAFNRISELK